MKTALNIIFALCLTAGSFASIVPLGISPTEEGTEDAYAVWVCPEGGVFEWVLTVESLQADLVGLPPGKYSMYVTAIFDSVHSDPSDTIQVFIPGAPKGLQVRGNPGVELKASNDLQNWEVLGLYYLTGNDPAFFKIEFKP